MPIELIKADELTLKERRQMDDDISHILRVTSTLGDKHDAMWLAGYNFGLQKAAKEFAKAMREGADEIESLAKKK